ncbi:VOC family protein [Haliangium sp.]|uniref:VOC family protein n=1 Tax=Haliangium sp. TaxID=2663208 RepID=UPI003D100127
MSNTDPSATVWTQGVHHVGLTVPDIHETRRFFMDVLGFEQVGEKPAYPAVFVSDGTVMLTLWQAVEPGSARPFDRKNAVGLHHVALRVADGVALDALYERLRVAAGVVIEFAPEALGDAGARHMMCAVPGGIRVEFIAPVAG